MRNLLVALFLASALVGAAPRIEHGILDGQIIEYEVVAGLAIYEGDIILGPAPNARDTKGPSPVGAVYFPGTQRRWEGAVIPYEVAPGYPTPDLIAEAIAEWETQTPLRFVPRTTEPDWVYFETNPELQGICFSAIGRVGGRQSIVGGANGCSVGVLVHEIGHAVGMWHEQARADRDEFVEVNLDHVIPIRRGQYTKRFNSENFSPYDYASVMHYSPLAFVLDAARRSMRTLPPGIPLGQRDGLSALDVDSFLRAYDHVVETVVVATHPPEAEVVVDGELLSGRRDYAWVPGSLHRLEPQDLQVSPGHRLRFARWSDAPGRDRWVEVDADRTALLASFAREYRIPMQELTGGALSVEEATEDNYYPDGETVSLVAQPADGWNFAGWSGFRPGTRANGVNPFDVPAAPGVAGRIRPRFTRAPVTRISSIIPDAPLEVDGQSKLMPHLAEWSSGTVHALRAEERFEDPDAGRRYVFAGWSDGVVEPERTIVAGTESAAIEVIYHQQFELSVGSNPLPPVPVVTADPSSEDGYYDAGTQVRLSVEPPPGLVFAYWEGDIHGSQPNQTVVMDGPKRGVARLGQPGKVLFDGYRQAASFGTLRGIAPGLLVSLFGAEIGPEEPASLTLGPDGRVTQELGGVSVHVAGVPSPMLYASRSQVNFAVPYAVEDFDIATVELRRFGTPTDFRMFGVITAVPELFTWDASGNGPAAALNQDGTLNSLDNPAAPGSIVMLFGTGEGATTPRGIDGLPAGLDTPRPVAETSAEVFGQPAEMTYFGGAPGLIAGVFQANVRIPADAPTGAVRVRLIVDGVPSRAEVTVFVD